MKEVIRQWELNKIAIKEAIRLRNINELMVHTSDVENEVIILEIVNLKWSQ